MDLSIFLEYGGVLLILVILEGLLAVDNAVVLAVMVKHLPDEERKKALFYGLLGAFVFRFASLFAISFLIDIWQIQALGALYLLFIAINHIVRKLIPKKVRDNENQNNKKQTGFWMTVFKVEVADIAFAIDSILAAVALGVTLPKLPFGEIGGMNVGHFGVIFLGGMMGVIIMRFAADAFVRILAKKPGLEIAAFTIVGWVGIKLAVLTLSHPSIHILSEEFAHSTGWKLTFYVVLVLIVLIGWFTSKEVKKEEK